MLLLQVLQLPEVLCIHLKRFRHELMFSSKISSAVSFPLKGLDMRPYLHTDCISKISTYELFSVICHYGTAGGGHYICYALNNGQWFEFDDQYVTRVTCEKVQSCEAYVLFYRKITTAAEAIRKRALNLTESISDHVQSAFISKQWLNRFKYCAEPGPIDNSDFLCHHGSINPDRSQVLDQLSVVLPLEVYEYLHKKFGGCTPITASHICPACQALQKRLLHEMEMFLQISKNAQLQELPHTHYLSTSWYTQWHNFVEKRNQEPPGPIDNTKINLNQLDLNEAAEVPECIWNFFYNIYGGGPEIRIKTILQRTESDESVNSQMDTNKIDESTNTNEIIEPEFVIPSLKRTTDRKDINIDKTMYSHGDATTTNGDISCSEMDNKFNNNNNNNIPSIDVPKNDNNNVNQLCVQNNVDEDNHDGDENGDDDNRIKNNSRRYRRRRKNLTSA